jgi:hypothetical protein
MNVVDISSKVQEMITIVQKGPRYKKSFLGDAKKKRIRMQILLHHRGVELEMNTGYLCRLTIFLSTTNVDTDQVRISYALTGCIELEFEF